ncbi:MAG: thermonuclease family protein [Chloroflexota bacterium]
MKRLTCLVVLLLLLAACASPAAEIVPAGTLAAQTLAARPVTNTPIPPSAVPPTATIPSGPPTPVLDLNLPGAYCLPQDSPRSQGLVTKIVDGETLEIAYGQSVVTVKLIGVDAPSIGNPPEWQAAQAYGFAVSLVNGKTVTLVQDAQNFDPQTGQFSFYVLSGNTFVNYEMIRQGFGRAVSQPPNVSCDNAFIAAQVEAQGSVRGVWQATPAPTWTISPTPTITFTPAPATPTTTPPCACKANKSCSQFTSQAAAQQCYNYCRRNFNIFVLPDNNNNGKVCEGLP